MTCRNAFYASHANMEHEQAIELFKKSCPDDFGYAEEPEYCVGTNLYGDCTKCWERQCEKNITFEDIADILKKGCEDDMVYAHTEYAGENNQSTSVPIIKDSGNRREFESGAVRDMQEGKGRMDLLPWAAIMEVSKHCENGARKYGEHNVDKGLPTSSFCDSGARHLAKYLDGWTDEPHLLAAAWNLLWAIQMEIKHPEVVDTPWTKREDTTNTPQE